jgi:hypothetical protein
VLYPKRPKIPLFYVAVLGRKPWQLLWRTQDGSRGLRHHKQADAWRQHDSSMKPIVAYFRVSTQKQARSGKKGLGLGLEAQREALERFAHANGLQIIAEFTEIETGKGADALELRPQLASALNPRWRRRSAR